MLWKHFIAAASQKHTVIYRTVGFVVVFVRASSRGEVVSRVCVLSSARSFLSTASETSAPDESGVR